MAESRRTFTEADRAAQARLRALWRAKAKQLGLTQEKAAKQFGGTQALISHYLTGRIALGRVAAMKFARLLRVPPEEIRDDFEFSRQLAEDVPEDVVRMAYKLSAMPDTVRKDLERTIDLLLRAQNYEAFLKRMEKDSADETAALTKR